MGHSNRNKLLSSNSQCLNAPITHYMGLVRLGCFGSRDGSLMCDHGVWLTFANIRTMGAYTVHGSKHECYILYR
uniref:Uncharacterized protein n=1 Tax=Arundo donax TaxID=35708 RepID=A0A0A9CI85_ARUDO